MGARDEVTTDALYLDTYTLSAKQTLHYIVIDAPLPAGAQVESGTWGIKIKDQDELPRANFQEMTGGYAVPLGQVNGSTTVQHLLRFSQRGQYVLPAARAYNMYRPDAQVLEQSARNRLFMRRLMQRVRIKNHQIPRAGLSANKPLIIRFGCKVM